MGQSRACLRNSAPPIFDLARTFETEERVSSLILCKLKILRVAMPYKKRAGQPLQVGAYTVSANTVTENVINVLEHFFNDFFLLF